MENKRIYLIVGASSDIGKNLIKSIITSNKNAHIIAHFRTKKHKDDILNLLTEEESKRISFYEADLLNENQIYDLIEFIKIKYECPDYIIHLPATKFEYRKIKNFDWKCIDEDLQIQVKSLGMIFKVFLPLMAKRHSGKVVIMLSSCTIGVPPKYISGYIVAKYALMGLMKSAAVEYADKGININGVSPNIIETKFLDEIDEKFVEMTKTNTLQKRCISINEVVSAIQYLLSDSSNYITGTNLNLSGGDSM